MAKIKSNLQKNVLTFYREYLKFANTKPEVSFIMDIIIMFILAFKNESERSSTKPNGETSRCTPY